MELAPGYLGLRLLRRNGGIAVYDAWSEARGCRCVVKVVDLRRGEARDRQALAKEGRLLLSLTHPHIVRAYELILRPRTALVLETLPGETLGHAIRARGRLDARDVAQLGVQLCSALTYLHGQGVLHLDLKPSNIVCCAGLVRLIDLGLARRPGRGFAGIGSAPYLAPEQARGGWLSAATDVFGLGAALYHAASGRAPFPGDGRRGYQQLRLRARVHDAAPSIPGPLAAIIDRCLDPDAAGRPGVAELRALLGSAGDEERRLHEDQVGRRAMAEEVGLEPRSPRRRHEVVAGARVHEVERRPGAILPAQHQVRAQARFGEVGAILGRP